MNLYAFLRDRDVGGDPIRVGVVGAGKFGTMFLAQARTTPGMHVVAVADLSGSRARRALSEAGFQPVREDVLQEGVVFVRDWRPPAPRRRVSGTRCCLSAMVAT